MKLLPFEYAVRNLGRSPLRLVLSVGGSLLVVLLVLASAGFIQGMQSSMRVSGHPKNSILLGAGSEESIERSEIAMRTAGIVSASVPGLRKRAGVDAVSPEIHLAMPLTLADAPVHTNGRLSIIRGVMPEAMLVHDNVILSHGRLPEPGKNELAAGQLAAIGFDFNPPELMVGESVRLDDDEYKIVGILTAEGGVIEGEFWTPLTDLQVTAQRDSLSCVVIRRDDAESADLEVFAAQRLDLELVSMEEVEYYAALSAFFPAGTDHGHGHCDSHRDWGNSWRTEYDVCRLCQSSQGDRVTADAGIFQICDHDLVDSGVHSCLRDWRDLRLYHRCRNP